MLQPFSRTLTYGSRIGLAARRIPSKPSVWLLLVYAALSALLFRRRRSGVQADRSPSRERRPATGEFATTRSTDEPQHVQHERVHERGRGRRAEKPCQIPWAGWKDIFWRSYQKVSDDRLLAGAAGVVFYAISCVPRHYRPGLAVRIVCRSRTISEPVACAGRTGR